MPEVRCNFLVSLLDSTQMTWKYNKMLQYLILLQLLMHERSMWVCGSYYIRNLFFTKSFGRNNTILCHGCPWYLLPDQQSISSHHQVSDFFLPLSLLCPEKVVIFVHSLSPHILRRKSGYLLSHVTSPFLEQITQFQFWRTKEGWQPAPKIRVKGIFLGVSFKAR